MSPLSHGEMVQMARMHSNSCVICGEEIPEGRMVCPMCEKQEPNRNLSHEKKLIRLIDAEELKHILNNSKYYGTKTGNAFADMITECKTIEARKKGKWIDREGYCVCNQCGHTEQQFDGVRPIPLHTPFCAICGADMMEEKTDG